MGEGETIHVAVFRQHMCGSLFRQTGGTHFEEDLDDACGNRELGELHCTEHLYPLVEQLLDVAQQATVHAGGEEETVSVTPSSSFLTGLTESSLFPV